jgi:hypothetical protein
MLFLSNTEYIFPNRKICQAAWMTSETTDLTAAHGFGRQRSRWARSNDDRVSSSTPRRLDAVKAPANRHAPKRPSTS